MRGMIRAALVLILALKSAGIRSQFIPKDYSRKEMKEAKKWVDSTYSQLSMDERLGQLFIIALYTNKGEEPIEEVRKVVKNEKIGGLILMQDDARREIELLNEFQSEAKVRLLVGMDAEWGLFQRIKTAYKLPWAITLGAIQDKRLLYEMSAQIAADAKKVGVHWDFAPVVDVNTNPKNPIIGNRSFGSDVGNVVQSALHYSKGLQEQNILAAIKHFPGHGDTDVDSHLDLPLVSHSTKRLNEVELAPFKALINKGIGGVMVAHLYVPALEKRAGIPASVSYDIVTQLLKKKLGYKGLIITDALNMGAVAKRYKAGELDAMAFKAGNDIMLFSQGVAEGKRLIRKAIEAGEIPQKRLEESVKKILLTKYYLGLNKEYTPLSAENIDRELSSPAHKALAQKLYSAALTLIKNDEHLLPLSKNETYYYLPLEEAPHQAFADELAKENTIVIIKNEKEIASIPRNSKLIVGLHKDNSTAYKPYKISDKSKAMLLNLAENHQVILNVFGSPYALKDIDITPISTVLVSYENNDDSMVATAQSMQGKQPINGRIPVLVNDTITYGMGMSLD